MVRVTEGHVAAVVTSEIVALASKAELGSPGGADAANVRSEVSSRNWLVRKIEEDDDGMRFSQRR